MQRFVSSELFHLTSEATPGTGRALASVSQWDGIFTSRFEAHGVVGNG